MKGSMLFPSWAYQLRSVWRSFRVSEDRLFSSRLMVPQPTRFPWFSSHRIEWLPCVTRAGIAHKQCVSVSSQLRGVSLLSRVPLYDRIGSLNRVVMALWADLIQISYSWSIAKRTDFSGEWIGFWDVDLFTRNSKKQIRLLRHLRMCDCEDCFN